MNILFFLTPKEQLAYIYDDFTIRQTLEKLEFHRYTAMPILTREGKYVGTIREGDLLWYIKNKYNLDVSKAEDTPILEVPRHHDNDGVHVFTNIEDIIAISTTQNFVPVLDDRDLFIGIVTRGDVIQYMMKKMNHK